MNCKAVVIFLLISLSFGCVSKSIAKNSKEPKKVPALLKLQPLKKQTRFILDHLRAPYYSLVTIYDTSSNKFVPDLKGSGVFIRRIKGQPALILTAAHVVKNLKTKNIQLESVYGQWVAHNPIIVKMDEHTDLALLATRESEKLTRHYVQLADHEPALGESVWAIGSPNSSPEIITRGIIGRYRSRSYRTDAAAYYGSSGGGLYNNQGQLVGIARSIDVDRRVCRGLLGAAEITIPVPGGAYFTRLKVIHRFLSK